MLDKYLIERFGHLDSQSQLNATYFPYTRKKKHKNLKHTHRQLEEWLPSQLLQQAD